MKKISDNNTTISVIVRCYNNAKTIERALSSISFPNAEVIAIDDGSTDESIEIIKALNLPLLFFQTRLGAINALNFGLEQARGEYYTIVDADDNLPPGALQALYSALISNPKAVGAYGDYSEINLNTNTYNDVDTTNNIFATIAAGWLFKRQEVLDAGKYDPALFFPEYDLLLKLQQHYQFVHTSRSVYNYYRSAQSLTGNQENVHNGIVQLEKKWNRKLPIRKY